jgi:hypothetical protein
LYINYTDRCDIETGMVLQLTLLHTYCNVLNNTSTSVCVVDVHDIDTGMLLQLTLLHTYCNVLNNTSTSACVVDVHDIITVSM